MVCLLVSSANGLPLPSSLPSGIVCHQGLELKQETLWLEKERSWGCFFLPFLHNIMTPI